MSKVGFLDRRHLMCHATVSTKPNRPHSSQTRWQRSHSRDVVTPNPDDVKCQITMPDPRLQRCLYTMEGHRWGAVFILLGVLDVVRLAEWWCHELVDGVAQALTLDTMIHP